MPKQIRSLINSFLVTLITIFLGVLTIFYILNYAKQENTGKIPEIEKPPITNIEPGEIDKTPTTTLKLIAPEENYSISIDPYNPDQYGILNRRLALTGNFKIAKLLIRGSVPTNKEHFLSINIGSESGIYNAVRNSADGLDIDLTKENLGVFTKDNPINLEIDLMGQQTLATTREEFLSTRKSTKLVKFWDFIQPPPPAPSLSTIIIAPFSRDGIYEGKIESLEFVYACKEVSKCNAVKCDPADMTSVCISKNFGEKAKEDWLKWYNGNK